MSRRQVRKRRSAVPERAAGTVAPRHGGHVLGVFGGVVRELVPGRRRPRGAPVEQRQHAHAPGRRLLDHVVIPAPVPDVVAGLDQVPIELLTQPARARLSSDVLLRAGRPVMDLRVRHQADAETLGVGAADRVGDRVHCRHLTGRGSAGKRLTAIRCPPALDLQSPAPDLARAPRAATPGRGDVGSPLRLPAGRTRPGAPRLRSAEPALADPVDERQRPVRGGGGCRRGRGRSRALEVRSGSGRPRELHDQDDHDPKKPRPEKPDTGRDWQHRLCGSFGDRAVSGRPLALRPHLAVGLPLSGAPQRSAPPSVASYRSASWRGARSLSGRRSTSV